MLEIQELDPDKPDTLVVLRENDVISASEVKWFRRQLTHYAGKSPQGKPRLRLVWGPTHCDEMSTDPNALKYVDFIKDGVSYGERRWFIEIHREPEFLARSGRYQLTTRQDDDGTKLLKEIQSEGCYDYWLRLERANLTYHPLDGEVLEIVKALWQWELIPQNQRDALEQADREIERRQMILQNRQLGGGSIYTGAVHPLFIPR